MNDRLTDDDIEFIRQCLDKNQREMTPGHRVAGYPIIEVLDEVERLREECDRLENRVASLEESYEKARESEAETFRTFDECIEKVEATGAHYEQKMGEMINLDIFRSGVKSIVDFWRQAGAPYSQAAMEEVARELDRFAARRSDGERRGPDQ